MKRILYIITSPPCEDLSNVISLHDFSVSDVRVLFIQEGIRCSPIDSYPCMALHEDVLSRNLSSDCPTIGYPEMVDLIFESDLVITMS